MVGRRLAVGRPAVVDVGRWYVGVLAAVHYGSWVADAAGSVTIAVRRGAVADRWTVDCQCAADVGGWAGGELVAAAREVTDAVVGLLIWLADTDVGGWADGGLAGACTVEDAGG